MRNRKSSQFKQFFNKNVKKLKALFKKNKRKNNKNPESFFQIKDKFYDLGKNDSNTKFKSKRNNYKIFTQKIEFKDLKTAFKRDSYLPYYIGLGGFLILGVIYILYFSSYFAITNVYIERADALTNIDIAYNGVKDLYGKPILTIDKDKITEDIKELQPNVKIVEITRVFPDKLNINLISYETEFNTTINTKPYLLLENGSLVPGGNKKSLSSLKIHLEDEDTLGVLGYSQFVNQKDVIAISILKELFLKNFSELNVASYDYFPLEREIHINLDNNSKLIFDLIADPKEQLNRLKLLLTKQKLEELIYSDLRIDGKIFYCRSKDERDWDNKPKCYNNLKEIYNYEF